MDKGKRIQKLLAITKEFIARKDMDCNVLLDITTLDCNARKEKVILQIVYPKYKLELKVELGDIELRMTEDEFKEHVLIPGVHFLEVHTVN